MLLKKLQTYWQTIPSGKKGIFIVAIPVYCLVGSVVILFWMSHNISKHEHWVHYTQKVQLETRKLLNDLVDAEIGARRYRATLNPKFLDMHNTSAQKIPPALTELEQLIQDSPQQIQRFSRVKFSVQGSLAFFNGQLLIANQLKEAESSFEAASARLEEGREQMEMTKLAIENFTLAEEQILRDRQQQLDSYRSLNELILLFSLLIGVLSGGIAIRLFLQVHQELVLRELHLQVANIELEEVCDRLTRFTANASHELRAPMAAILSNAQVGLMSADRDSIQPRQRLEKIVPLTMYMATLVKDLLFLARHDGATSQEHFLTFDLQSFLYFMCREWEADADQNIKFSYNLAISLVRVSGDADLIRQVMINLLSNAYRYTPTGGEVHVQLEVLDNSALIEVTDTGFGISPEALPYIFERFYREERVRSKFKDSSGLGLAIVQQIVNLHQGKITVTSEVDQGTTFQVYLPLEPSDS